MSDITLGYVDVGGMSLLSRGKGACILPRPDNDTETAWCPATNVISGFYEDEVPQFRQGYPVHELESLVTAEEVNGYVQKIKELADRLRTYEVDHVCLLCGRTEPCMAEADLKPGDPGVPCTFDPTPRQWYEENKRLREQQGSIRLPQSKEEAEAMVRVGMLWLEQHGIQLNGGTDAGNDEAHKKEGTGA